MNPLPINLMYQHPGQHGPPGMPPHLPPHAHGGHAQMFGPAGLHGHHQHHPGMNLPSSSNGPGTVGESPRMFTQPQLGQNVPVPGGLARPPFGHGPPGFNPSAAANAASGVGAGAGANYGSWPSARNTRLAYWPSFEGSSPQRCIHQHERRARFLHLGQQTSLCPDPRKLRRRCRYRLHEPGERPGWSEPRSWNDRETSGRPRYACADWIETACREQREHYGASSCWDRSACVASLGCYLFDRRSVITPSPPRTID
jgi:hypothetical protein